MDSKYKKLLAAAVLVPVVGLAGYQAYNFTSALFTDTETSTTNTFAAGTLNMTVGGEDGHAFENFDISNIGASGVVSGGKEWTITNTGTVPGYLTFKLNDVTNLENGCNEAEKATESACEADTNGELGDYTHVTVQLDRDGDGQYDETVVTSDLADDSESEYASQWNTNAAPVLVDRGKSVKVKMNWSTDPNEYDNRIQSDSLSFGIQYDLTQVVPTNNTPTPTP
jgi:hypothetical protein